ncbi:MULTISPECIES: TIR domain-containing protein [unclassified Bartonella]|uniref:TIR domain-containing protein n=1 Tax=unclassified Bartonella TaxID=2645622 RepID=UPI0035D1384F
MPKIFIVYNDHTILEQTERVLFKLGLEPYVLKFGSDNLTTIEDFKQEISMQTNSPKFGIVLLTPDDIGYEKSADKKDAKPRANQNVIFKMGMLIPKISCRNIAILKQRDVEVPSDYEGINYIPFNEHVKETLPKLIELLNTAGFNLDTLNN